MLLCYWRSDLHLNTRQHASHERITNTERSDLIVKNKIFLIQVVNLELYTLPIVKSILNYTTSSILTQVCLLNSLFSFQIRSLTIHD